MYCKTAEMVVMQPRFECLGLRHSLLVLDPDPLGDGVQLLLPLLVFRPEIKPEIPWPERRK